ncbi:ABC transporter permease [Limnohabitans sp.]|uniref:ABC transporter permease n=1 Tax=Limnohabitans sp. TaxID=1907725 RepID=UPI0025C43D63|nr:ABC transporter permease [Limnohabitans sp.]
MEFDVILRPENLRLFWEGSLNTLSLLLVSLLAGGLLSLPMALARVSKRVWLRGPAWLFTYVVRGTPLLIQVYLIYYGLGQMEYIQARWDDSFFWRGFKEPFFCAALAFSLNTCAYTTELLAGAMRHVPAGEIEAARACGLSEWACLRRIVLPSALRRSLPGYANEVIMMLHSTSLASAVPALLDITGAARSIYADFYLPFEAFISAGLIYLSLTLVLVQLFRLAEKRWLAHLRPRPSD